jgi:hypothetical protein
MTPQEQQLISQLFERLRQAPAQEKDPEAEALIQQGLREQPDAPYLLVQTVLIQDMTLTNAQARIAELERELAAAKSAQTARRSTSFLGGLLHGSVPSAGAASRGPEPVAQPQAGWAPSPNPMPMPMPMQPMMMPGAGSGFLQAAAATALGVVGGELLFQGVHSMFGGHMGLGGLGSGMPMQPSLSETVINNYNEAPEHQGTGGDHPVEAADHHSDDSAQQTTDQSGHDDGSQDLADADQDSSDQDVAEDFDSGGDFGGDDSGFA